MADLGKNQGRLSIVVHAGAFDRVHYALMMAAAAAAVDRPVTLFFTMGATQALRRPDGWVNLSGAEWDDHLKERNIADFETLLLSCAAMDVGFMVCEAGLKAEDMSAEDLRDDIAIEVSGLVTFFGQTEAEGQTLFV
ncbi:MAG: DsrE family protein [Pseudomonadota bacterium]